MHLARNVLSLWAEVMFMPKKIARLASLASGAVMSCALLAFGCAPPAKEPAPAKDAAALAPLAARQLARLKEARELRDGRVAWCSYLDSLYRRGQGTPSRWLDFDECVTTPTTASGAMLKATAACSMDALQNFDGNPFTKPEYGELAGVCGAVALDRSSSTGEELAHLTSTICARANACGISRPGSCELKVESTLGTHLDRVLGALNSKAKGELRRCISHSGCGDIGDNITACLEPIMDRLLYSSAVASNTAPAPAGPLASY